MAQATALTSDGGGGSGSSAMDVATAAAQPAAMDADEPIPDTFFLHSDEDLPYEEDLLRNPFTLRTWQRYLEHKAAAPPAVRFLIYERGVKELPGSYKLWKAYLDERRASLKNERIDHPQYSALNSAYERALVFLHKMPRIWLDYVDVLIHQQLITKTRQTMDRALRSLPLTQHERIWKVYLPFVRTAGIPEMAVRVYRRYLKLEPGRVEEFIDYLISVERYDEAANHLAKAVNDDDFRSINNKTNLQLWMELADMCSKHPEHIKTIKVDAIIRNGITRFTDKVGELWIFLAEYYTRQGQFELARNVYEEAVTTVMTVRDFSLIFDAYAQSEETLSSQKMASVAGAEKPAEEDEVDMERSLARFELLMDRRPFLVNDVLLRQNPNNVVEWENRVKLHKGNPEKIEETYNRAVYTIDPKRTIGSLPAFWVAFSRFYEDGQSSDGVPNLDKAREVFERAVKVNYKSVDDLAQVWCDYAEMEIRHRNAKRAVELLGRATSPTKKGTVDYFDENLPVQARLFKAIKLWSFYVDLQESIGTVESTKAVYDRILELKIATPQIMINYAFFLEENKYFEDSFKVYERGIEAFKYPVAFEIWNTYLIKFIARYGGEKLERARDLFEQALNGCPTNLNKSLFLMYAKLEEDYGLARHAMKIYDRATRTVDDASRQEMFLLYIQRAADTFGVTATREIYERAIETLPDSGVRDMCLRYADLERKLGEIDRARGILTHGSQYCDPRSDNEYWQTWHDFEVKHGNEDTFREMLRIKRSVVAMFNSQLKVLASQMPASLPSIGGGGSGQGNAMQLLESGADDE